jgi:hypothetical protein
MPESIRDDPGLLKLAIAIFVAVYTLGLIYILVFQGVLDPRPVARIVIAGALGWVALRGRRWGAWVLAGLSLAWSAEQVMWFFRGALDSIFMAIGLLAGFAILLTHLFQTRSVSDS